VVDAYERGISIDALSKGLGLPGLRAGWVVCRDRSVLARVVQAKSGLSSCLSVPSEVLALIALRAGPRIVARNRTIARSNRQLLRDFLRRHPEMFADDGADSLAFVAPRYLGGRDACAFAVDLVRAAGVLLLPFGLWRSPLAPVPADRLRIGLGGGVGRALAVLDEHLASPRRRAAVA
jgi:aspartate/methionine/tyrosine aminotransferase